jgi:Spy/CpxP family protein refolding chaperone
MNRSLIIVLGALALGAALFIGSLATGQRLCRVCATQPSGSLNWLQKEYHLNNNQMTRIQKLHEDYIAQCDAMCQTINKKKQEVEAALNNSTNVNPVAAQKIEELAACRAHCQSQMLQYFIRVSQILPPDQGHRYLAEMEKNTFGFGEK